MKNPRLEEEILSALVKAVKKPVTVKIRKGFDEAHCNAVEAAVIPGLLPDEWSEALPYSYSGNKSPWH